VTKRWLRRRRGLYPVWLPSYPLPPVSSELVFEPVVARPGMARLSSVSQCVPGGLISSRFSRNVRRPLTTHRDDDGGETAGPKVPTCQERGHRGMVRRKAKAIAMVPEMRQPGRLRIGDE
jgi:hypothetical protein